MQYLLARSCADESESLPHMLLEGNKFLFLLDILPKQVFKDLDINIANLNILYASSHNELRDLLANGKVDIIASFWKENDKDRFSKNYITPLSNNITGTRWYLKMQQNNTDLLCAVQEHLMAMSKDQELHYYQNVLPFWQCENNTAVFKIGENNE